MKNKRKLFSATALLLCVIMCCGFLSGFTFPATNDRQTASASTIATTNSPTATNIGKTPTLTTKSFNVPDNSNYDRSIAGTASVHPLGKPYANVSLNVTTKDGYFEQSNTNVAGIPTYGVVPGTDTSGVSGAVAEVRLQYNWNRTTNLNGWDVSKDSHKNGIQIDQNNFVNPGVINTGALIIQKSYDGLTWEWENTLFDETANSYHSTDFTNRFKPTYYSGTSSTWTTERDWHPAPDVGKSEKERTLEARQQQLDRDKEAAEKKGEVYTGPTVASFPFTEKRDATTTVTYTDAKIIFNHTSDGKATIYTPSGKDMGRGVFIKAIFAYEVKGLETIQANTPPYYYPFPMATTVYKNILEETTFYLCNSSGEIFFTNIQYSDGKEDEGLTDKELEEKQETLAFVRMFGTIKNNHASTDGFRLNFLDVKTNTVKYRKNGSTNWLNAHENQAFFDTGKYDFEVTTAFGNKKHYTIYINEKNAEANRSVYFGNTIISENSQRIFTTAHSYPVYVANQTWWQTKQIDSNHMPLVGRIYKVNSFEDEITYLGPCSEGCEEECDPSCEGTRKRLYNGELMFPQIGADGIGTRTAQTGKITEAGNYRAIFANNQDFFTGNNSGDTFRVIFEFIVVDKGIGPSVNEELIKSNIGFSDYMAGYWGVTLPTASGTNVTFAFVTREAAHTFAVNYFSSSPQTTIVGNKFLFQGNLYPSYLSVSRAHAEAAETAAQRKYFDATDPSSYRTIGKAIGHEDVELECPFKGQSEHECDDECITFETVYNGILARTDLEHGVVVFAGASDSFANRVYSDPFLNDKRYSMLDENGKLITDEHGYPVLRSPLRFIQATDFETNSVTLFHEGTNLSYVVPYGAPVEAFLSGQNAPTGRYRIEEKNAFCKCNQAGQCCDNKTIYYGIYIRLGDIQTSIVTERFSNGNTITQTLGLSNANTRFTTSGFIIRSASNQLDPYGIIKIENLGTGKTDILQLDEIEYLNDGQGYIIDKNGNYLVHLVDRLGNTVSFAVDIYSEVGTYNFTLMNNGQQFSQQLVFGGQRIALPTPTNPDNNFEFIGWEDSAGKIHTGTFTYSAHQDVTLTSVWNFKNTTIIIIDGSKNYTPITTQPSQKVILPMPERDGFEFFGFESVGTSTIYYGQITSVPNLSQITLKALWVDYTVSHFASPGFDVQFPTPIDKEGFIFAGWLYETSNLSGHIFKPGDTIAELDTHMNLVSLWYADPDYAPVGPENSGLFAGIIKTAGTVIGGGALFMLLAFAMVQLINRLRKLKTALRPSLAFAGISGDIEAKVVTAKSSPILMTTQPETKKRFTLDIPLPRLKPTKKFGFMSLAICMAVVMVSLASWQLMLNIKYKFEVDKAHAAVMREHTRQMDIAKEKYAAAQAAKQNTPQVLASQAYVNVQTTGTMSLANTSSGITNELELSDEEAFLYSLVFIDLLSFGYDVFPAIATTSDEIEVRGFGYTNYEEVYEHTNGTIAFGAGFVSLLDESVITENDVEDGVTIKAIIDEEDGEVSDDFSFLLTFEEQYGPLHYIAFEHYLKYSVRDFRIVIESNAIIDDPSLYDVGPHDISHPVFDLSLGYLYSYDRGMPIYDDEIGIKEFIPDAFSLAEEFDYEFAQDTYAAFANEQLENGINIENVTAIHIGESAIAQFMLNNQDESFLGLSPEEIYYMESMLPEHAYFYYIDEHGELNYLEIPPDPVKKASIWQRIAIAIAAVVAVVVTVVVVAVTCGAAAPLGAMIIGLVVGVALELVMQVTVMGVAPENINWTKVAISGAIGAVSGAAGSYIGAIGKGAATTTKMIKAVKFGLHALSAGLSGGILGAAYAWIDTGSWDWAEFGIGFATGFALYCGTQALSAVSKWIGNKLRPKPIIPFHGNEYMALQDDIAKYLKENPHVKIERHHIVEQCQINKSGFTKLQINDTSNLIDLPKDFHHKISGYYTGKHGQLLSLRNSLANTSFEHQTSEGWKNLAKLWEVFKSVK